MKSLFLLTAAIVGGIFGVAIFRLQANGRSNNRTDEASDCSSRSSSSQDSNSVEDPRSLRELLAVIEAPDTNSDREFILSVLAYNIKARPEKLSEFLMLDPVREKISPDLLIEAAERLFLKDPASANNFLREKTIDEEISTRIDYALANALDFESTDIPSNLSDRISAAERYFLSRRDSALTNSKRKLARVYGKMIAGSDLGRWDAYREKIGAAPELKQQMAIGIAQHLAESEAGQPEFVTFIRSSGDDRDLADKVLAGWFKRIPRKKSLTLLSSDPAIFERHGAAVFDSWLNEDLSGASSWLRRQSPTREANCLMELMIKHLESEGRLNVAAEWRASLDEEVPTK